MGGGEAPAGYLSGIVILENGMRSEFYLDDNDMAVLEKCVKKRLEFCRDVIKENEEYTIADELARMIIPRYLNILKDRIEKGKIRR